MCNLMQTQIRSLLKEWYDQCLHYLLKHDDCSKDSLYMANIVNNDKNALDGMV